MNRQSTKRHSTKRLRKDSPQQSDIHNKKEESHEQPKGKDSQGKGCLQKDSKQKIQKVSQQKGKESPTTKKKENPNNTKTA